MSAMVKLFGAIFGALVCIGTGAYVLWQFHTTAGLIVGVALVLLALAIALPTDLRRGSAEFRNSVVVVVEEAEHALKGEKPKDGE